MVSRSTLGDVGLALLAVVTIGAAGYVLVRDPLPPETELPPVPVATSSPQALPSAAVLPTQAATPTDVVLLRSATTPGGHVVAAAEELGWNLTNAAVTQVQPAALAGREVVLVQVGQGDQDEVVEALPTLRQAAPSARLVVVAPLVPVTGGTTPQELATAVEGVGGELLDPAALGWLQDPSGTFQADGSFTPQGAEAVGADLAAALDDA